MEVIKTIKKEIDGFELNVRCGIEHSFLNDNGYTGNYDLLVNYYNLDQTKYFTYLFEIEYMYETFNLLIVSDQVVNYNMNDKTFNVKFNNNKLYILFENDIYIYDVIKKEMVKYGKIQLNYPKENVYIIGDNILLIDELNATLYNENLEVINNFIDFNNMYQTIITIDEENKQFSFNEKNGNSSKEAIFDFDGNIIERNY